MALVTRIALGICIGLVIAITAPAKADWPPLPNQSELQAKNEKLRKKLGKAERRIVRLKKKLRKLQRANRRQVSLGSSGLTRAFLCIHEHEGAWNAATGNGYHGGLQMDRSFMRSYGPNFYRAWGGAENWPSYIQLAVGINAYLSGRGFHPWPNTARKCGLL